MDGFSVRDRESGSMYIWAGASGVRWDEVAYQLDYLAVLDYLAGLLGMVTWQCGLCIARVCGSKQYFVRVLNAWEESRVYQLE
jgi:hypothetical protein